MRNQSPTGVIDLAAGDGFDAVLQAWPGGRLLGPSWRHEPARLAFVVMHEYHWFVPAIRNSFPALDVEGPGPMASIVVVPPLVTDILEYVSRDGAQVILEVELAGLDDPGAPGRNRGLLGAPALASLGRRELLEALDTGLALGGSDMDFQGFVLALEHLAEIAQRAGTDVLSVLQFVEDVEDVDLEDLQAVLTVAYS